jgi:sugar phosphate permease
LAEKLGWVPFFIMTTIATVPALLLLVWIARRDPASMRARAESTAVAIP